MNRLRTDGLSNDACGCATSARFMAVALVAAGFYYGWQWHVGRLSVGHSALAVLGWAFLAALVGKLIGIAAHRMRGHVRATPPIVR